MRVKLFLFFLFALELSFSQNQPVIDSLQKVLITSKEDTNKLKTLVAIADEYKFADEKKVISYCDQIFPLADKLKNLKATSSAYNILGVTYCSRGEYKKGRDFFEKCYEVNVKLKNLKTQATAMNNIGISYYYEGNYQKSLSYYINSLKIMEQLKNDVGIADAYGNIGNVYRDMNQPQLALDYYEKGLVINKKIGNKNSQAINISNMAAIYTDYLNNPVKSIEMLSQSIALYKQVGNMDGYSISLLDLADIFNTTGEYDKSLKYAIEAKENLEKIGDRGREAQACEVMGMCYLNLKNYKQAEQVLLKAIELAKETELKSVEISSYEHLAKCYAKLGNTDKAYAYEVLYALAREQIFTSNSSEQIAEMQTKYETEKKEQENKLLSTENELKNVEIEDQKTTRNYLVGILILTVFIISGAILAYRKIRTSNKLLSVQKHSIEQKNHLLEEQKEEIEEKNKEIVDSINYAQKIQSAILPTVTEVESLLENCFVLFKPKDIVSGDFYWISEKEDYIFYATADCTGHGVPGGFMSMLGTSLLNEVVNEKKIYEPADILDMLRIKIILALKQKGQSGENKDGMDMVLCRINKKKTELTYAAANNPLWLIRNGECIEYKADKQPVGISGGVSEQFNQQTIALQPGDNIYTYTDGYADQFGGPKGKKFKYKQLLDILIANAAKPAAEQKELLGKSIDDWKGNLEQVDDILIIGIRV